MRGLHQQVVSRLAKSISLSSTCSPLLFSPSTWPPLPSLPGSGPETVRREICRGKKKKRQKKTSKRVIVCHWRAHASHVRYSSSAPRMTPSPFHCFSRTKSWDHAWQAHICANDYERVNVKSAAKRGLRRGVWPTVELNFEMDWFSLQTLFAQFPPLPSPYHLPYISYHWDSFMGPISSLANSQMMENWSLLLWYYSDCGPISERAGQKLL